MAFSFEDKILKLLPSLRLMAREHCKIADEADSIVALALARATAEVDGLSAAGHIEPWLISHLETEIAAWRSAAQH